jgi:selenide,water dikinase
MSHLNQAGAELAEKGLVRAATDITGYGLLGHLSNICRESGVSARVRMKRVPVIGQEVYQLMKDGCVPGGTLQNLETANAHTSWGEAAEEQRALVCDAQTSGGLLLCVNPELLESVKAVLKRLRSPCVKVIGELVPRREPLIDVLLS